MTTAATEVALAKHQLNQVKAKARLLQQEKRNIYDQISAADELKKQQQVRRTQYGWRNIAVALLAWIRCAGGGRVRGGS